MLNFLPTFYYLSFQTWTPPLSISSPHPSGSGRPAGARQSGGAGEHEAGPRCRLDRKPDQGESGVQSSPPSGTTSSGGQTRCGRERTPGEVSDSPADGRGLPPMERRHRFPRFTMDFIGPCARPATECTAGRREEGVNVGVKIQPEVRGRSR